MIALLYFLLFSFSLSIVCFLFACLIVAIEKTIHTDSVRRINVGTASIPFIITVCDVQES